MAEIALLADLWPIVITVVGLIVWAARLESRVNKNSQSIEAAEDEISGLRDRYENLNVDLLEKLASIRESLAHIEGALGIKNPHKGGQ